MGEVTSPGFSSARSQLSMPCPHSPPDHSDLYGRRREMAMVDKLEREIGFLEEELKSAEGFQPASGCCEEIAEFVVANSDPLMPTNWEDKRTCRFWKWLCSSVVSFPIPWSCFFCSGGCSSSCCSVGDQCCSSCLTCSAPKSSSNFIKSSSCIKNCCNPRCTRKPSCPKVPPCCNSTRRTSCNNQCCLFI